jgi:hypothetical protein
VVLGPRAGGRHRRARKLERATSDLERLARGLGSRHYPTVDKVQARLAAIAKQRRVGAYLRAEVGTNERGMPTLTWHFDPAALEREQATDGWYGLLTNLDPARVDAAGVLARYKGQEVVERRYGAFKGRWRSHRCSCSPTGASRRWSP